MCQYETQKCLVAGAAQKVLNQFIFASESYSLCLGKKKKKREKSSLLNMDIRYAL